MLHKHLEEVCRSLIYTSKFMKGTEGRLQILLAYMNHPNKLSSAMGIQCLSFNSVLRPRVAQESAFSSTQDKFWHKGQLEHQEVLDWCLGYKITQSVSWRDNWLSRNFQVVLTGLIIWWFINSLSDGPLLPCACNLQSFLFWIGPNFKEVCLEKQDNLILLLSLGSPLPVSVPVMLGCSGLIWPGLIHVVPHFSVKDEKEDLLSLGARTEVCT